MEIRGLAALLVLLGAAPSFAATPAARIKSVRAKACANMDGIHRLRLAVISSIQALDGTGAAVGSETRSREETIWDRGAGRVKFSHPGPRSRGCCVTRKEFRLG